MFRNVFNFRGRVISRPQKVFVRQRQNLIKDGVEVSEVCDVSMVDAHIPLPDFKDYSLSNLLDSGIPLQPVNTMVVQNADVSSVVEAVNELDKEEFNNQEKSE